MKIEDQDQLLQEELSELHLELEEILTELDDPNMNKDISENSARDDLIERLKKVGSRIKKLEKQKDIPKLPGTWNIGDRFFVTYKRIVTYGKDVDVPPKPIKCQLVVSFNITKIENFTDITEIGLVPVAINSPLGKVMLHKAHNVVRYDTPVGYCEVELERCYT